MKKYLLTLLSLLVLGGTYTTAQADDLEGLTQIKTLSDLSNGWYYIVADPTTFYAQKGKSVAFYDDTSSSDNYLYWNVFDETSTAFAFNITKNTTNDTYTIKSISNRYPSGRNGNDNHKITMSSTPAEITITENTASNDNNNGVAGTFIFTADFTVIDGGTYRFYVDNSGYGSGNGSDMSPIACNGWSTNISSGLCKYSYWRIYKVTDSLQNAINTTDTETLAKITAIASLKSDLDKYGNTENYVFGMTKEKYSEAESVIGALDANKNTLDEINAINIEDYVTKLTTGYYRIQNLYYGNADKSIVRVGDVRAEDIAANPDKDYVRMVQLYADMPQDGNATKKDISTVFKIVVPSGQETSMSPTGLKIMTQGRCLISTASSTNYGDDQVLDATENNSSPYANLVKQGNVTTNVAERALWVSDAEGNGNNKSYYYKKNDSETPSGYLGGWSGVVGWSLWNLIPATDILVDMHTVGDNSYATLCAPFGLTIKSEGLTAYTAVLNTNKNYLLLTELGSSIPGGTPVILIGSKDSSSYHLYIDANSDYATTPSSDYTLQGQYLGNTSTTDELSLGYVTNDANEKVVGFYKYSGTIGANKARIPASASPSKGFTFSFGDDDPTGINSATTSGAVLKVGDVIYDLQGRRVQDAKHGIYIINGKKTVVK